MSFSHCSCGCCRHHFCCHKECCKCFKRRRRNVQEESANIIIINSKNVNVRVNERESFRSIRQISDFNYDI